MQAIRLTISSRIGSMTQCEQRALLFDIDGTLLNPNKEGRTYFGRALVEVFGETGPIDDFDMAGKTDWQIVTELMTQAGFDPELVAVKREAAFTAYARHVEIAAPTFSMAVLPGVLHLLEMLSEQPEYILGLVTGNVKEAVPHKLKAVGIDPRQFSFGAFGSEHPDRNALPGLAISRLEIALGKKINLKRVLVIGDTPRDIACARHAGVKVLCVATGHFSRAELASHAPDFLLDDLTDAEAVLEILQGF
jgi:phosphoglycolate phosphatase